MGDKVRHLGLTGAALCAVAGLTATTADAGGAVTTSLGLPLSGAVFQPGDPCVPNGEIVRISGNVHVVSIVPPDPIAPVDFTLQHTDGCQDTLLPVSFTLNFDASGHLVGGSASLQTGGGG